MASGPLLKHACEAAMFLIQILLPVTNTEDSQSAFNVTREELAARFGGVTAYTRSPAQGLWTAPDGEKARDLVVMVEVVTEEFDRSWWRTYQADLARRFQQEEIHVRAISVDIP